MICAPVDLLAKNPEPAAERRVFTGEARAGADVGEVEDEIVDRIRFVLQTSCDRQSFTRVEKRKEQAAPRGSPIFRNQAELAPGVSRRIRNDRRQVMLELGTLPANQRQRFPLRRFEQRRSV